MAARRPARNAGLMSERGLLPINKRALAIEADFDDEAPIGIWVLSRAASRRG